MNRSAVGKTLVLNATYEPINIVDDTRAVVLILLGKAVSELDSDRICGSATETLMFPSVIRLVHMAMVPRLRQMPLSRRRLFERDSFTCQYCGEKPSKLTVEHIIPRSQGGKNVWQNVTTACTPCNAYKRDRTPEQAGMKLLSKPYAPSQLAIIAAKGHSEWAEFLGGTE